MRHQAQEHLHGPHCAACDYPEYLHYVPNTTRGEHMTEATTPLLSVVTVVRNDPAGLERTRESLERNIAPSDGSGDQVEWIVIDGSDSPATTEPMVGCTSRTVLDPPRGIFEAMNRGLSEACGSWVYFLNAGDTLADDRALSRLLEALRKATGLWGFARVNFHDARGGLLKEPAWDYDHHRRALFAQGHFPPHQGTVVRTDVLRYIEGFDTKFRVTADYHAALRLSSMSEPELWDWPLAEFQQGGTSSSQWKQALREMHVARREVFRPRGWAAFLEMKDTVRQLARSVAARVPTNIRG